MMTNLNFNYLGGESPHYEVDRIDVSAYGSELLFSSEDDFGRIVSNETNNFKTVSSSIVLGAMANGDLINLKPYVISEIVNFFLDLSSMEQIINLNEGFHFISTNVDPVNPDMTVVVQEILNDDLKYIRNSEGSIFHKIGPNWVNGIGDWIGTEGYLFKTTATGQFTISGELIAYNEPIDLVGGFQFVSYLPSDETDAVEAFSSIIGDDLIYVRNSAGSMLRKIGPNWINGIGSCIPTEGYLIKMLADATLTYPNGKKVKSITIISPEHFVFEGGNAADPIYTIYVEGLNIGDEVAAYDGHVLIGAIKINSQNIFDNDLPVFSTLNSGQGYTPGKQIILKLWDASSQSLIPIEYTMNNPYNDAYIEKVYPSEDGLYSIVNVSKSSIKRNDKIYVYPNPATDEINISSPNKICNIVIFNCVGQLIYQGNETKINISNFEDGIYIIHIKTDNVIETKKFTIQ